MTTSHRTRGPLDAPTIVRTRAPGSTSRSLRPLERLGRTLALRALGMVRHGSLTLIEADATHRSPRAPEGAGGAVGVSAPHATVRVLDARFYSAAAFGGSTGLAEAYMDGLWETDDLPGLIETLTVNYTALTRLDGVGARLKGALDALRALAMRNTFAGSRRNIRAHYDLGDEFFALFLDDSMLYSCAVFENGAETLPEAQREKIDRACRKLELRPEHHLLEIGSGWGAMAVHAAGEYGCRVTTTTISDRQHDAAVRRVREAGLGDRVTVLKEDYRNLTGTFDRVVSIEMIEAIGAAQIPVFFEKCSTLLKPDGALLVQAIVIRDQFFARAARRIDFLKKYIFPGSCLPSVEAMTRAAAGRTDLRVWHTEDIGPHYVRTLALWREAFHARLDEVRDMGYDERFIRMWDYYFAYCEGAFRARHVGDVQMLWTKPLCRVAPVGAPPGIAPGNAPGTAPAVAGVAVA
ncbi:MAG: class I SAM-dependent methyltransferase [Phycisphaerales bacterium]|nr:MAG: class I SAM-dependent methyltransferase [Phycisphaerales bacterium]